MVKQSQQKDPLQKAQRKLEKAQHKLELARDKYAQARAQADKLLAKAEKRIEERARAVADAEVRLLSLSSPTADSPALLVEALDVAEPIAEGDEAIVPASSVADADILRERERAALAALLEMDCNEGISAAEWRSASGQTETTLGRARDVLAERGLIAREGPPGRGARYRITEEGRAAALELRGSSAPSAF
jgi:hypothetical protein